MPKRTVEDWRFRIIDAKLNLLLKQGAREMSALQDLEAQVRATVGVQESVVVLLQGLKEALDEAILNGDPVKLEEIRDLLATKTQELSDAAVAAGGSGG